MRLGTFRSLGDWVSDRNVKMKITWRQLFVLSVAILLLGSGVWANVWNSSLSQNTGAWVSHTH
jgi:hypothetical protein